MAGLENLKNKYEAVLQAIQDNGVVLSHINMDGGKLFIQGAAPSQDAKNEVWDVVKSIDPAYGDLTLDLSVDDSLPQDLTVDSDPPADATPVPPTPAPAPAVAQSVVPRTYIVQPGDTLSKIAKMLYGEADQYSKIFEANQDILQSPNVIRVGQELRIP